MKYFLAIALIAAVASAGVVKPTAAVAEIQQIVQAINSPSTDPATAVVLEALLQDLLAAAGAPVVPGPVNIVDHPTDVISVGPAIVDAIVQPAPVAVAPVAAASAESNALVQIIVNVNQAVNVVDGADTPAIVEPVQVGTPVLPVVVDPVQVGTPVLPVVVDPVQVGTPVLPVVVDPVQVGTPVLPVVVDPVQVGTPILPAPVVVLPEELN